MKICILGNSHTACVKRAWDDRGNRFAGHEVSFFASTGNSIVDTVEHNRKIVPTTEGNRQSYIMTSGGHAEIDLNAYDQIVLYGIGQSIGKMATILRCMEATFFSRSFKTDAVLKNNMSSNHVYSLFQTLQEDNVWLFPRPNTASSDTDASRDLMALEEESTELCKRLSELCSHARFRYIQQPVETLLSIDQTLCEFNIGGYGLGPNPKIGYKKIAFDKNRNHMNKEYGMHALATMFQRFTEST